MFLEEIYENLCYDDPRNPSYFKDDWDDTPRPPRLENCGCDNCFYGRDRLAMELLKWQ